MVLNEAPNDYKQIRDCLVAFYPKQIKLLMDVAFIQYTMAE